MLLYTSGLPAYVTQVQSKVDASAAADKPYVLDCPANSFPRHWAPQQSNKQLFEVDLKSSEIADLMAMIQRQCSVKVVKVWTCECMQQDLALCAFPTKLPK